MPSLDSTSPWTHYQIDGVNEETYRIRLEASGSHEVMLGQIKDYMTVNRYPFEDSESEFSFQWGGVIVFEWPTAEPPFVAMDEVTHEWVFVEALSCWVAGDNG